MIAVAVSVYVCTIMFILLLSFAIYNTWNYLIKQGKWHVISLSMFYALTIVCLSWRIFINIFTIPLSNWVIVSATLYPAVLKICIGIVQVAVIIEITVRVKESYDMLAVLNAR